MNMTHPDILKMERDGFLGKEPEVVAECEYCGHEIYESEDYYDIYGTIICDEYHCIMDFMKEFKTVFEKIRM